MGYLSLFIAVSFLVATAFAGTNINFNFNGMLAGAYGGEGSSASCCGNAFASTYVYLYNQDPTLGDATRAATFNSYFASNGTFEDYTGTFVNTTEARYEALVEAFGYVYNVTTTVGSVICVPNNPSYFVIQYDETSTNGSPSYSGFDTFILTPDCSQIEFYFSGP